MYWGMSVVIGRGFAEANILKIEPGPNSSTMHTVLIKIVYRQDLAQGIAKYYLTPGGRGFIKVKIHPHP